MKILEIIDDETGAEVEVDKDGNPVAQTPSTPADSPPTTKGASEGLYEPPPPPGPAFSSYTYSPAPEYRGRVPEEAPYGDNSGQQQQFVPQDTQQRENQQHNENRRSEEGFTELLRQQRQQHEQQRAQQREQQRAQQDQAQTKHRFQGSLNLVNPSMNQSFIGGGAGIGIGASNGYPGLEGPHGRPMPFGAAVRPAPNQFLDSQFGHTEANSFAPMPFTSNAGSWFAGGHHNMYSVPGRYRTPTRDNGFQNAASQGYSTMFEQPSSRYQGENQQRSRTGGYDVQELR